MRSQINFQQAFTNIISNPNTKIADELAEYLLTHEQPISKLKLDKLLNLFPKKIMVEFAIGEAKLVLHVFETMFPDDSRPRDALAAASLWLRDHDDAAATAATAAYAAAYDAYAAGYDAYAAGYAAYAAYAAGDAANAAYYAAYYARTADDAANAAYAAAWAATYAHRASKIIFIEDQVKRLFKIVDITEEKK